MKPRILFSATLCLLILLLHLLAGRIPSTLAASENGPDF